MIGRDNQEMGTNKGELMLSESKDQCSVGASPVYITSL